MKSLREWDQKGVLANYLKSITQMRTDDLRLYLYVCAFKSLDQSVQEERNKKQRK